MSDKRSRKAPAAKAVARPAQGAGEMTTSAKAAAVMRPSVNAALVVAEHTKGMFGELDFQELVQTLSDGIKALASGDVSRVEAMLFAQAHALQALFMALALRARNQEHLKPMEAFLRMALKAQSQCRMTLETLAMTKNPPIVLASRQTNIAHGPQQVNNSPLPAPLGPRKRAKRRNELMEASDGERLDAAAATMAIEANSELATVGEVDRAAHRRR